MNLQELIAAIEQWAEDRNIIKGSKPIDQAMKLFSEFGELADNVGKGRDCRDDIGDVFVVATIICAQNGNSISEPMFSSNKRLLVDEGIKNNVARLGDNLISLSLSLSEKRIPCYLYSNIKGYLEVIAESINTTLVDCVSIAYNDIKDRKGVMFNGVFIKDSDPAYQDALDNIEADKRIASQKRISVNIEDL